MSRETGNERIRELINAGELGQVAPDTELARRMLADARRHLATAAAAEPAGDLSGAYQLAYDALRKSAASLLEAQGLRATSRGGHIAIQDAVMRESATLWLPSSPVGPSNGNAKIVSEMGTVSGFEPLAIRLQGGRSGSTVICAQLLVRGRKA